MTAVDRWADQLARWEIPQHLLDAVEESPYGWPQWMWKRRSEMARDEQEDSPTTNTVRRLAGRGGAVLDIGAGRGRASLSLAGEGHPLVAIEKDPGMAAGLREEAEAAGLDVTIFERRWPDAADVVEPVQVVMSAHVVYDVPDIGDFVAAMHDKAQRGVVIELTPEHPWAPLAPYYRVIHDLPRPDGPTAADLSDVVEEVTGIHPRVERWERPGQIWYDDWDEIIAMYGRRLVVPEARRRELRTVLAGDVSEAGGRLYVGDPSRTLVTMWWEKTS